MISEEPFSVKNEGLLGSEGVLTVFQKDNNLRSKRTKVEAYF